LLAALLIVAVTWLAPGTSGFGILIVLTGVPAYFFWRKLAAAGAIELKSRAAHRY